MRLLPEPLVDGVPQPLLHRVDVVVVDDQVAAQILNLAPTYRKAHRSRVHKILEHATQTVAPSIITCCPR